MPATDDELTVYRDDPQSRYEIAVGDVVGGYTEFYPDEHGRFVFPHTVIDPAFRGRGLAKVLVERAMADVAARGETVVPRCPVVRKYLLHNKVPGLTVEWPTLDGELVG